MAPVRANEEPVLSEILSEIEPNLLKINEETRRTKNQST